MLERSAAISVLLSLSCGGVSVGDAACPNKAGATPADVVAQWDDGQVTLGQLEALLDDELRTMDIEYRLARYDRLHAALDGLLDETLLDRELARRGLPDRAALFAAEVDAKITEPTEPELQAEFRQFQEQMPHASFEAAKPFLRKELVEARREQRRAAFLEELRTSAGVEVAFRFPDLPRVDVPVDAYDPVLGPDDAAVTIVQFGGYQCFYCKRVDATVRRLVDAYDGRVRVVYKDFPLAGHARARTAAIAAHCAGQQDHYWDMAAILLENQARLEPDHLHGYAEDLGLDAAAWAACTNDTAWGHRIDDDVHLGRELGVTSTPTFFVNGLKMTGAHRYDRFAALVDQELARVAP